VIDATRRLVEHTDERHGWRPKHEPRSDERGGDAIQDKDIGAKGAAALEHGRRVECRKRERAVRK
jgi:hypothetical protein